MLRERDTRLARCKLAQEATACRRSALQSYLLPAGVLFSAEALFYPNFPPLVAIEVFETPKCSHASQTALQSQPDEFIKRCPGCPTLRLSTISDAIEPSQGLILSQDWGA